MLETGLIEVGMHVCGGKVGWRCCEEMAVGPESRMSAEVEQRGARLKTGWRAKTHSHKRRG